MITLINKTKTNADEVAKAADFNTKSSEFTVSAPGGQDGKDPDMFIEKSDGSISGLEYKMSISARMENPSIKFINKVAIGFSPLGEFLAKHINDNNLFDEFNQATGIESIDYEKGAEMLKGLKVYSEGGSTRIIDAFKVNDLGEFTRNYYAKKGCHYMQIGDNFYRTSDVNPLDLSMDIPLFDGTGIFGCRINFDITKSKKGAGKWNYPKAYNDYMADCPSSNAQSSEYKKYRSEWINQGGGFNMRIIPEFVPVKESVNKSPYSLQKDTNKLNPFV